MPTFGSLFSGIGGLDLGLERAGWECKWEVEIDEPCRQVLAYHWPEVPRFSDVKELSGRELEPVELICGGFPCQPVSAAGKQRAQADDRWLWPEFARVLGLLRPRYVLVENVPNLLTVNGGSAFGDVLGDLARLGFDAEWSCLSACAVGASHTRERLFVLAYAASIDGAPRDRVVQDAQGWRPQGEPRGLPRLVVLDHAQLRGEWLSREPEVDRVVAWFPDRVRQLERLGNAVVPQVAEWIGRRLMEAST